MDPRLAAAILAGKATGAASRVLGRGGGTTLPGDVAMGVDSGVLAKLTRSLPEGVVLVTGTNGKTTTTGMIVTTLEHGGRRVLTNASGANLIYGLTAAAVAGTGMRGLARADLAVFEVDELVLERAVAETHPRMVVVLNLMRDQLDRSGELQTTANRIGRALRGLDSAARVVANVDDPLVWAQCDGLPNVIAVGIDSTEMLLPGLPQAADARNCPRCEAPLVFDQVVLSHCGIYRCPNGDFGRPRLDVGARHIAARDMDALAIDVTGGARLQVGVGGLYNAYNAVAAYAACRGLGLTDAAASQGLEAFRPRFGRQESLRLHGRELRFMLAKNPSGLDEVLRTADELGRAETYLIALNDQIADGRDVSWIWDVDFERLARSPRHPFAVLTGRRASDLAVRLKYAGVSADHVIVVPDRALALARVATIGDMSRPAIILPTYTAMLELRAVAEQAGAVRPFWSRPPGATTPT